MGAGNVMVGPDSDLCREVGSNPERVAATRRIGDFDLRQSA